MGRLEQPWPTREYPPAQRSNSGDHGHLTHRDAYAIGAYRAEVKICAAQLKSTKHPEYATKEKISKEVVVGSMGMGQVTPSV